jgi:hypothetical protein
VIPQAVVPFVGEGGWPIRCNLAVCITSKSAAPLVAVFDEWARWTPPACSFVTGTNCNFVLPVTGAEQPASLLRGWIPSSPITAIHTPAVTSNLVPLSIHCHDCPAKGVQPARTSREKSEHNSFVASILTPKFFAIEILRGISC